MNPALSVVVLTASVGAAQGLVVALALAALAGTPLSAGFSAGTLLLAEALLALGLAASFGHLGRPERAWRAALMWRTSWLSREVIALPTFMGVVALWWWAGRAGAAPMLLQGLALAAIGTAALLWYCTAMIYACLRFIEEWAQPLTLVNFVLIGLASGSVLASALAAAAGASAFLLVCRPAALLLLLLAWFTRTLALRRNAVLKHRSTLQSATGIDAPVLVQKSMGMSAGAFNTREFFHGRTLALLRRVKVAALLLGFALPALLALLGLFSGATWPWDWRWPCRCRACWPIAGSSSPRPSIRKICTTKWFPESPRRGCLGHRAGARARPLPR